MSHHRTHIEQLDDILMRLKDCAKHEDKDHVPFGERCITRYQARDAILALISKQEKQAFRNGQLDCQKAGDPTNHRFFKEAVSKQVSEARIDELELAEPLIDYEKEFIYKARMAKIKHE